MKTKLARHAERIRAIRRENRLAAKFSKKALKIFTKEIARRLEDLNHAHQLNTERNAEFVRIDMFHAAIDALNIKLDPLIGNERERKGEMRLPLILIGGGAAALGAAITIAVVKLLH